MESDTQTHAKVFFNKEKEHYSKIEVLALLRSQQEEWEASAKMMEVTKARQALFATKETEAEREVGPLHGKIAALYAELREKSRMLKSHEACIQNLQQEKAQFNHWKCHCDCHQAVKVDKKTLRAPTQVALDDADIQVWIDANTILWAENEGLRTENARLHAKIEDLETPFQ